MELLLDIFIVVSIALGCFFAVTGAFGLVRFPDFFTRIHAAGITDTLGAILIIVALLAETVKYSFGPFIAGKLVLITMFVLITAPVATHAISKAAILSGMRPDPNDPANKEAVDD